MLSAPASMVTFARSKRVKHSMDRTNMLRNFLTGSKFEGTWTDDLRSMDGLGEYTYPDGTTYRGYFERGRFHGRGTITFPKPYDCTIRGQFVWGSMTEIEDMWFADGLQLDTQINGDILDFSKWVYCTPCDRRFLVEHLKGQPPVGPLSNISATSPTRVLGSESYDLEGGVYDWKTGVIKSRPPPFCPMYVLCCPAYRSWVHEECRHSNSRPVNISPQRCQNIIRNNLESERDIAEHETTCNFDQNFQRRQYFSEMCKQKTEREWSNIEEQEQEGESVAQSDMSTCDYVYSDTTTTSSFSWSSLIQEFTTKKKVQILTRVPKMANNDEQMNRV